MTLSQRYRQAAKEARWALGLSLLYVIGWCVCAYLPKGTAGPLGFPLWFADFLYCVGVLDFTHCLSGYFPGDSHTDR